jgi:hypothetical protein
MIDNEVKKPTTKNIPKSGHEGEPLSDEQGEAIKGWLKGNAVIELSAAATVTALREATPELLFTQGDVKVFLSRAKAMDESVVRIAMPSPDTSFESIGLDPGLLSENDARVALEHFFEKREGRQKLWIGFLLGIASTVITGLFVA